MKAEVRETVIMNIDRRSLLTSGAFAMGLSGILPAHFLAQAAAEPEEPFDEATFDFWTGRVRKPSQFFAERGTLPPATKQRGIPVPGEADFLFFNSAGGGFEVPTEAPFAEQGLVGKGDVSVSMSVDTIRLSSAHRQIIKGSGTGSLRVDMKQGQPLHLLSETLNWSAIGNFKGENAGDFHTLGFDPKSTWGRSKQVPLASGIGFWSWNFTVQKGASKWSQLLQSISGVLPDFGSKDKSEDSGKSSKGRKERGGLLGSAVSVLGMGLPAIAETAFKNIDAIYGFLHGQTSSKPEPVFTMEDTPLLATQEARQEHHGRALALKPGTYLIVPSTGVSKILSGKYTMQDYALVPQGTKPAEQNDALEHTLEDLTYLVASVDVIPPSNS
jgi:hypothetical protein